METEMPRILLVEDNPDDAVLFEMALTSMNARYMLAHADNLKDALDHAKLSGINVVVLDLCLPDSHGLNTLTRFRNSVPDIPTVVLTGMDDTELGINAVQAGAQDYLIKGSLDGVSLGRSLRYAMERHRQQEMMRSLSLTDELTGLYNRRGFLKQAQRQITLANRTMTGFLLLVADMDNLKPINDGLGHLVGDEALIEIARVLEETLRQSDVCARMGGDEFAAIVPEADAACAANLVQRIEQTLELRNRMGRRPYSLSLSVGAAEYDPMNPASLETMIARADEMMYEQKRRRRSRLSTAIARAA